MIYSWFASLSHATSLGNLSLVVPTQARVRIKLMSLLSKLLIGRECNFSKFKQILAHPPRHLWDVLKLPGMIMYVKESGKTSIPFQLLLWFTELVYHPWVKIASDRTIRRHIVFFGLFTDACQYLQSVEWYICLNELTGKIVDGRGRRQNYGNFSASVGTERNRDRSHDSVLTEIRTYHLPNTNQNR
jgi:hypothetical protein